MLEVIKKRRSIRLYKNSEVSDEQIKELLYYATLAPSGKNMQPWHFVVIKDKDKKEILATSLESVLGPNRTSMSIIECSALIMVYNTNPDNEYSSVSIGAAIENLLLAATSLEIGTLWIGLLSKVKSEVDKLIVNDYEFTAAIAVGYANEDPEARPRKTVDEVVEWI